MAKIKLYIAKALSNNSGAAKGTAENPYTEAEYEEMLNNGTWPGGYVQNLGYCLKEVVISSSYPDSGVIDSDDSWSSDDFDSWNFGSDPLDNSGTDGSGNNSNEGTQGGGNSSGSGNSGNPYPQVSKDFSGNACLFHVVENVGAKSLFSYQCGVRISGYTMYIGISVFPYQFKDRDFWATAVVKSNGDEAMYRLTYKNNPGYIYGSGWVVIGDTSFDLPKSGNVTVHVHIGYNYDTGVGHTSKSDRIKIYPF